MNISESTIRHHARIAMMCGLLSATVAMLDGDVCAQDIQAVSARLKAAGEKVKATVAAEKLNIKDSRFVVLARWHQAKEKILTRAVAAGEITETEADFLRIEIVKAEAAETATQPGDAPAGRVTAAQVIEPMDKNGDGKISRSEASEDLKLFFEHYDLNKNGEIDRKEAEAIARYVNHEKAGSRGFTPKQLISFMDRNGDGKLSKDESSEEIKPYFEHIDKNNDGLIDVDEAHVMVK